MITIQKIKERLKRKIDNLPEDKLGRVSIFLESLEIGTNKEKILSFAGSWKAMNDEVFEEIVDLESRRKSNRTRFF
ncbi:MAG TPA: hypothetical protein VFM82_01350 [Flavobacteriaceae bacterium]|nr:hypothetical protein [Flavobacteriaceae bacterium]